MANKTYNKLFLLNYFLCSGIDDDGCAIAHRRDRIIPHKDALPLALITPCVTSLCALFSLQQTKKKPCRLEKRYKATITRQNLAFNLIQDNLNMVHVITQTAQNFNGSLFLVKISPILLFCIILMCF